MLKTIYIYIYTMIIVMCDFLYLYRAFSSRAWLIIITCCGNRVLYAESSKLGKLTSEK